jgi:hypothetical protein
MKPADLGFVRLGHSRGLGQMALDRLRIQQIDAR